MCLRDESYPCDSINLVNRRTGCRGYFFFFQPPSSVTNAVEYELEGVFFIVFSQVLDGLGGRYIEKKQAVRF